MQRPQPISEDEALDRVQRFFSRIIVDDLRVNNMIACVQEHEFLLLSDGNDKPYALVPIRDENKDLAYRNARQFGPA